LTQLGRIQAADVTKREKHAVVGRQPSERIPKVYIASVFAKIDQFRVVAQCDLVDDVPAPRLRHLARFVCRNRQQPRPQSVRFAQTPELSPRLDPRPLRSLLSNISVAAHRVAHAQQVRVVQVHDVPEGAFVSKPCQSNGSGVHS